MVKKLNQEKTKPTSVKILWDGPIFNPTGWATVGRELCREIAKRNVPIQVNDFYNSYFKKYLDYDNPIKEFLMQTLNFPINPSPSDKTVIIHNDYPRFWRNYSFAKSYGFFVHEGTRVDPSWINIINQMADEVFVLSKATKNLAIWNGIIKPIHIIPAGVNPDVFKPKKFKNKKFVFSFVNSWTGSEKDRKGFPLVLKAFVEEFKKEKDVVLYAKISTFWQNPFDVKKAIINILGKWDDRIYIDAGLKSQEEIAEIYQKSDCVVLPTNGESFGLTIAEAMACGCPVIVTKDKNSGHMDFTNDELVYYIKTKGFEQGDRRFYVEGNLFPIIDFEDLKKQMRYVYEHPKKAKRKGLLASKFIRKNFTWKKSVDKLLWVLNGK